MGGRGAKSSIKLKSRFRNIKKNTDTNNTTVNKISLNNKKNLFEYIKHQLNIDLSKVEEPKMSKSRTYAGVHLEDLSINERNAIKTILNKRNIKIENNGGYGYAIKYEKSR